MTVSLAIWGPGVPISRGSPYRSYTGIASLAAVVYVDDKETLDTVVMVVCRNIETNHSLYNTL